MLSVDNAEKQAKEKLIETILENTQTQVQGVPTVDVSTVQEKATLTVGDDENDPAYVQLMSSADLLVQTNTNVSSVEISAKETAVSGISMSRKMATALAARDEMRSDAPQKNGLGSEAPSIPSPPLPPSGCPDYDDLSSSDINSWILHTTDEQIESALMRYFEYLTGPGKTDPTGLMKLMNFIAFLSSHKRPDGSPLINQNIANFIDKNCNLTGSSGTNGGIALWVRQMADYAYAAGYDGKTGDDARNAWIADEKAAWSQFPSNKWTQDVEQCLGDKNITVDQNLSTDAQGNIIYTYDGVVYYWKDTGSDGSPFNDRTIIMSIFNGHSQEINGVMTQDPFYTGTDAANMERDYRTSVLDALLKEFKDPIWAIQIFFLQSVDSQFQANMSGHAREEDDVTDWQVYATTLNEMIQKFQNGTATKDDAHNFVRALYGAKLFVDQHPDLFSLDGTVKTNVFDMIGDIKTNGTPNGSIGAPGTITIKDLITRIDAGDDTALAKDLNNVFSSAPPSGGAPVPTVNSNTQTALNASNTLTSLVTGQSKNDVTIQAQDSSIEAALNKVGGDMDQLYSQLGKAFCGNQKSA